MLDSQLHGHIDSNSNEVNLHLILCRCWVCWSAPLLVTSQVQLSVLPSGLKFFHEFFFIYAATYSSSTSSLSRVVITYAKKDTIMSVSFFKSCPCNGHIFFFFTYQYYDTRPISSNINTV